jgi:hypothetical protein
MEIGQVRKHKAVHLLGDDSGEGLGQDVFTIQRVRAVHLRHAHRDNDHISALQVFLHFIIGHLCQNTGSHFFHFSLSFSIFYHQTISKASDWLIS